MGDLSRESTTAIAYEAQIQIDRSTLDDDIGCVVISTDHLSAVYREAVHSFENDIDVAILKGKHLAQLLREFEEIDKLLDVPLTPIPTPSFQPITQQKKKRNQKIRDQYKKKKAQAYVTVQVQELEHAGVKAYGAVPPTKIWLRHSHVHSKTSIRPSIIYANPNSDQF